MIGVWVTFLLLIAVFIVIIIFITGGVKKVLLWRPKFTYISLGIYIVIGLLAMFIVQGTDTHSPVSEVELQEALAAEGALRDALWNADYKALDSQYLQEQWTFLVEGDTVTVHYPNQYGEQVYVNYRSEQGNEIILSYYATPNIQYYMDISDYVKRPTVSFANDSLQIEDPQPVQISYHQMKPILSLLENSLDDMHQVDSAGTRALYLNVPQNVHIINEGGF